MMDLLSLPLEIRKLIWLFAVELEIPFCTHHTLASYHERPQRFFNPILNLLLVCQQVKDEITVLKYRYCFVVQSFECLHDLHMSLRPALGSKCEAAVYACSNETMATDLREEMRRQAEVEYGADAHFEDNANYDDYGHPSLDLILTFHSRSVSL
jgi:hypothetical protein